MFVLNYLLWSLAILVAFVVLRFVLYVLAHFFRILPEYLWHSLLVLLFTALIIGIGIVLCLPEFWNIVWTACRGILQIIIRTITGG